MKREDSDVEIELHAYVDGDLDEETMARVEDYLRGNAEAAQRVRDYLQQKHALRRLAQASGPLSESPDIDDLKRRLARRLRPGGRWSWDRSLIVAAMFAIGWIGHMFLQPVVDGPAYTGEAVQAHLLTTVEPGELQPISKERLARLFTRVGSTRRVPDLTVFGFEPMGAELVPSDDGILLHVPYRDASGTTISYFLMHDHKIAEVPRHILHRDGVTLAYWQHQNERYAVAAPLTDDEVTRIANYLDNYDFQNEPIMQ